MKYLLAILLAVVLPAQAATQDVMLDWSEPTTREDGTPLAAGELDHYVVYYAIDGGAESVVLVSDGSSEAVTLTLAPQVTPYVFSATVSAVDVDGNEGGRSNMVLTSILISSTAAPNPPTNLTVTIVCVDGCTIEVQQ